jgi:hypothetical protein
MKVRFLAILVALTSCATANRRDAVLTRAPFDLDCPRDQINVDELGDRTFGARGCGKKATYLTSRCWSGDFAGCKAVLNGTSSDQ